MTTNSSIEVVYQKSKEAYLGLITNKEASDILVKKLNLNPSSALTMVQVFQKLLSGEKFTRTLSVEYFDYFLGRIYSDFGIAKLDLALTAINKHIHYIKGKGDSKVKLKTVVKRFSQIVLLNQLGNEEIEVNDEKEQTEIGETLKGKSKEEVTAELKNASPIEPEIVLINGRAYKRDNKTIAQIKFVRDYKCQICSTYIMKSDGNKYVEAAHIVAKSMLGAETPNNILLLCPNHHKEFDLGNREILSQDENKVHFVLNEKEYIIEF